MAALDEATGGPPAEAPEADDGGVAEVTEGVANVKVLTEDEREKRRAKKQRAKLNKKNRAAGEAAAKAAMEGSLPSEAAGDGGGVAAAQTGKVGGVNLAGLSREEQFKVLTGRDPPARRKKGGAAEEGEDGAPRKEHKFWDTQPVPKHGEEVESLDELGPLVKQTVEEIRKEPYPMAPGMEWSLVDITTEEGAQEVYTLLTENYVEDDDNMFRFDYSIAFLNWALTPPNYSPDLHLGVRASKSKKLMAFISGVPATMRVHTETMQMVEINFLCVHKKLRSKRLAPVLIKEITRRTNVQGVFQAVYTAGVVLPKPVAECRYWHRSLNPKKLVDIGFSRIAERQTMARLVKLYRLPDKPSTYGLRPMTPEDVPSACKLLNNYLQKFSMAPVFNEGEFAHQILPRPGVVDSFVVTKPGTMEVTDMISFYHLPSSIMKHEKHKLLRAAYSYYNVATSVPLNKLMEDSLIMAKKVQMDVFNALDIMDNSSFLKDQKFGIGDGHLQYYLYNYRTPLMESNQVGLVLL